ncbi:HalX domain-containing protein [Halobellus limi]|uniref:Response regulator n=1 Tax=Halobellus limi TaxID=699433 RepID=A0A1H5ZUM6_9EURY|nr:HalX domain-containing protein [Halobellus limi]QCC47926.1 response regulator [Halobellus limi]SEG40129.1 Response regulator receiver domain-containing protein [Halobellus limi]
MSADLPMVLVVEDEPDLADLYATWLRDEYRVRVAYGGREALEELDEEVDVVLLDRRMPDLSGDEALEAIRERDVGCRVAMVTAVEPDFDIVAMGFDDYLVKPVSRDSLKDTVENLLRRNSYDDGIQELFALASKKALLESEKDAATLEEHAEYQELTERVQNLRAELDETLTAFDDEHDFTAMYRDLGGDLDVDADSSE